MKLYVNFHILNLTLSLLLSSLLLLNNKIQNRYLFFDLFHFYKLKILKTFFTIRFQVI